MGYEDVSLLGGLAQGFAQGQMASRKIAEDELSRESQAEMNKLKAQALKIELEQKKLEAQRAKLFEPIIAQIIQAQIPQQTSTTGGASEGQFGESFGEAGEAANKTGVSQQAALLQMMQNPLTAALFEKYGLTGAGKMPQHNIDQQRLQNDTQRAQESRSHNSVIESATDQVVVRGPDGVEKVVRVPRYTNTRPSLGATPPALGGGGLGATPPKLGGGNLERHPEPTWSEYHDAATGKKMKRLVNKFTGEPVSGAAPVEVEPVKALTGETSGKLGNVMSGMDSLQLVKANLFENGKLIKNWRAHLFLGDKTGIKILTPVGAEIMSAMEDAVMAKLRAETGASMPESEKPNADMRFKPKWDDSEKLVTQKIDRLENYLKGQIYILDPNKKYGPDAWKFKATDGKQYVWEPASKQTVKSNADMIWNQQTGRLEPVK